MGKSRVFRSWVRSYYIVLLFPVLLSTAVFLHSSVLIRRQLNTADLATLESAKDTVDTQFRSAFNSMAYVITNTSAQTIRNRKAISGDDYAALNVLHEMVRRYSVQSPELIDLFVFFPNSDTLVDRDGISRGGENAIPPEQLHLPQEAWEDFLRFDGIRSVRFYTWRDSAGRLHPQILLLQKNNRAGSDRPGSIYVLAQIDMEHIQNILVGYETETNAGIVLTDAAGAVRAGGSDTTSAPVLNADSRYSGLRYSLNRARSASRTQYYFWAGTIAFYLSTLVIGALLVRRITQRNYSPLQNLLRSAEKMIQTREPADTDEYAIIEHALMDTFSKASQTDRMYRDAARDAVLRRLVRGRVQIEALSPEERAVLDFQSDLFIVALFGFEDVALDLGEAVDESSSAEVVDFLAASAIQEMRLPRNRQYVFALGELSVCLINLPDGPADGQMEENKNNIDRTVQYLSDRLHISVYASMSAVCDIRQNLDTAYYQAKENLEHGRLTGCINTVMAPDEKTSADGTDQIILSQMTDLQFHLHRLLMEYDYPKAESTVNALFDLFFAHSHDLSSRQINVRMSCMIQVLESAFAEHRAQVGDTFWKQSGLPDCLWQCGDYSALRQTALDILRTLEEENVSSVGDPRTTRLIEYIHQHYTRADFNLNALADQFDLSPSYCSQLVRRCTGKSAAAYIQQVRMEHAKHLLISCDLSLREIASVTGFGSQLNLIRSFKREEGVTPSEWKNVRQSRQEDRRG